MKTVWVTGSNGFIGSHIVEYLLAEEKYDVFGISKGDNRLDHLSVLKYCDVDLSGDFEVRIKKSLPTPNIIIHCAAISQVDVCESNPELCEQINVNTTQKLISIAEQTHAEFVFFSSDFVFDGTQKTIYEGDKTSPISVYGKSKEKAERLVQNSKLNWSIIRRVLVYGYSKTASRNNIFSWVYNALKNKKKLHVVNDQFRTPTLVADVVNVVSQILERRSTGIYHIGGKDVISVHEFAVQIARISGEDETLILEKSSDLVGGGKLRPRYSCADISRIKEEFQITPLGFEEGISYAIEQIENTNG